MALHSERSSTIATITVCVGLLIFFASTAGAKEFTYTNLTDLPSGPGEGKAPSINDVGEVAFFVDTDIHIYTPTPSTFTNISLLPGAPPDAWFPCLNNAGNVVMIDPFTRNLWFYEASTESFTNVSSLAGYPGNSGANFLRAIFDLSDSDQISFHSGDINNGDVYVYDHANGSFLKVTDRVGGSTRGRENRINNNQQVAYGGFPDIYIYDLVSQQTVNITDLPGGPGTGLGSFSLNDNGDIAIYNADVIYYDALSGSFLYLSTLPGFPASNTSTDSNDLSNSGEIVFWKEQTYYFDPIDQSFTQLNGQGSVPAGGMESSINGNGEIAFNGSVDVWLATSVATSTPRVPSAKLVLQQNVPNPFNPSTVIEYSLPHAAHARLSIFDVEGRRVRTLVDEYRHAGPGRVNWAGRDDAGRPVASGVYLYRLESKPYIESRRMILIK